MRLSLQTKRLLTKRLLTYLICHIQFHFAFVSLIHLLARFMLQF